LKNVFINRFAIGRIKIIFCEIDIDTQFNLIKKKNQKSEKLTSFLEFAYQNCRSRFNFRTTGGNESLSTIILYIISLFAATELFIVVLQCGHGPHKLNSQTETVDEVEMQRA